MTKSPDFWVGDRLVRPSLGEIQLGFERVHLEPRSIEVLLALARHPGEVREKKDLIATVWGEAFVSDEVLTHAVWDLRRAFGDNASDPEFIQTIPKRGYRLIAPVKPIGPQRRRATDRGEAAASEADGHGRGPRLGRILGWGLPAIALLLWVALRLGGGAVDGEGAPEPAGARRLLLTISYTDGPEGWGERLESTLGRELAGTDLEVIPADSCAAAGDSEAGESGVDYCLEARLLHPAGGYEAVARLLRGAAGGLAYSVSAPIRSTGENLEAAAAELAIKIRTFFEVIEDPFFDDPDVAPWISFQDHDIRAIRDFLLGLAYVYRNESGGRDALTNAIQLEPDFVAPRVLRTPTLVSEADPVVLAEHRRELDRLYPDANGFEKAMIRWSQALIDGDRAEQIQQLRIALGQAPGNRQIEFVLGATLAGHGDLEEGWRHIEPLLGQNWHYSGLYPAAAEIAILRDRIDDIRQALDLALEVEPVDPEALAVMTVLAIYDEDAEAEARYRKRLELRRRELAPEEAYKLSAAMAQRLAARAESEGREAVAARLRESAN